DVNVTFPDWLAVGFPASLTVLILCYVIITRIAFRNQLKSIKGSSGVIRARLAEMGPLSKAERMVLIVFGITAFSWIFRDFINDLLSVIFYGRGEDRAILDDTLIAMIGGLLMFTLPTNFRKGEFLLTWEDMKKLPWGILILFGGGLCLAKSLEDSGLIQMIGDGVASWGQVNLLVLTLILSAIGLFLTELMSNVALTTIFVPVVFGIADGFGYNPAVLAVPVTLAASCAFCLPISTPPNAILFASGHIRLIDMVRAGIILNIVSLTAIVLLSLLLV